MSAPAPKGAAYVQRHDADSSLAAPIIRSRAAMVTWCKAPAEVTRLRCVRSQNLPAGVTGPRFRFLQYKTTWRERVKNGLEQAVLLPQDLDDPLRCHLGGDLHSRTTAHSTDSPSD